MHEARTRVTCNLPVNSADEERAVYRVIEYLEGLRNKPLGVNGFMHSPLRGSTFRGYWWDPKRRKFIRENVAFFVIDYELDFNDLELSVQLESLRNVIQRSYLHYTRKKQDEIWGIAHPVTRLD